MVLACLRESIASIYTQKKFDKLDKETNTSNWEEFIGELKIIFSNKSKVANVKWKIEMFRQYKKYIANFMIKFEVLAIKAKTDNLHTIFLLKKNIWVDIIKIILEYPPIVVPEILKEWKMAIISVGQGHKLIES